MRKLLLLSITMFALLFLMNSEITAQEFIGDDKCMLCHNSENSNTGYNIYEEYIKTGHPYKLNAVDGAPPEFPENTSPGVPNTPEGHTWDDVSYVIGGYGWKARFIDHDGWILSGETQWNLETEEWVSYSNDDYDFSCFKCHTTGASTEGSWNGVAEDSLGTWAQPGIRCEGCHGPGSEHMANPSGVAPPNTGDMLTIERCADCHQRGGKTNAIPASGGYIKHHEQINEMRASKHGDGQGAELTCASCHDAHVALRYEDAAGEGLNGITTTCQTCHPNREIQFDDGSVKDIDCTTCHMPMASKSAVGMQVGNGWRGDVPTHIMAINTDPVTKDAMFNSEGNLVVLDAEGLAAVTMDFACLQCHTNEDVQWASTYAKDIHTNGITSVDTDQEIPVEYNLAQNYPNPFNPTTTINFAIPKTSKVSLIVYSITGEKVAEVVNNLMPVGKHSVVFDASRLSSGVYIYKIAAGDFAQSRKMMILK